MHYKDFPFSLCLRFLVFPEFCLTSSDKSVDIKSGETTCLMLNKIQRKYFK